MILPERVSRTGLVFSALYLFVAITILALTSDCRGESCVIQLFVTFPWCLLFLRPDSSAMFLVTAVALNAIILYLIGYRIGKLVKRIAGRFGSSRKTYNM